jgi:CRISPR-associated endonuclease/helicase Cas3
VENKDLNEILIGHSGDNGVIQPLEEHLENVADIAMAFCDRFDAAPWGYDAGLLHDDGKARDAFQKRIKALMHGKEAPRVDHSTPGARYAAENINFPQGAGKLLAYTIAGHHSGLPNGHDGGDTSSLARRLSGADVSPGLLAAKMMEINIPPFMKIDKLDSQKIGFPLSFFLRMVYSALVDADFLDTEAFMNADQARYRGGASSLKELYPLLQSYLTELQRNAPDTAVNKLRGSILSDAMKAADLEQGLFSLTVPTGGGKTLSSLAFAFTHALRFGMERIIYVIPYTSIIEQTAEIFRSIFGENAVLEHHSNFIEDEDNAYETSLKRKLACENWDAPIIVTTNVQFFESFFSNRSSRTRRIHNVANSVVILDEAQMLPVPFLRPTMETIRELSRTYKTTVVLCTATQPALLENDDFKGGLAGVRELMPNPQMLEKAFIRVSSRYLGNKNDADIADIMNGEAQVLCIVNTRAQARNIMSLIPGSSVSAFHLSALMCPKHRRDVLQKVKQRLADGLPCKLVSTQLVEAGVDIDFPLVIRAIAGIDSIVQAAGRCNREGKQEEGGRLLVFYPEEGLPRGFFRQNAQITQLVMHGREEDYLSSEVVHEYFRELYWLKDSGGGLDKEKILEALNRNAIELDLPFKKVAGLYKLIPNDQTPVVVPYDEEAMRLCKELRFNTKPGALLRKLQQYTVSLYPNQLSMLISAGFIEKVQEQYYVMTEFGRREIYQEMTGIRPSIPEFFESGFLMT